jgi:glycogen debranching enzyme
MQSPPTTILHADYTVLCSSADGSIAVDRAGLFDYDTRILSRYRLLLDGRAPELVGASQPEADTFVALLRVPRGNGWGKGPRKGRPEGPLLPEDALEVDLERVVGAGMHDRWRIRNHSAVEWTGTASLEVDADFADVAEIGRERRQSGELTTKVGRRAIELRYRAQRDGRRFERAVRVHLLGGANPVDATERRLGVTLTIEPRGSARFEVRVGSRVDGRWRSPARDRGAGSARGREAWRSRRLRIEAPERLRRPFERALEDLFALRNRDLEQDLLNAPPERTPTPATPRSRMTRRGWILNAGVPTFTGYFGRDTLTSGWQAAMAGTEALRGALEVAAATQATTDDPWRDAEPGKMLHELRRGPLAMLGITPRDGYYGSQTTPAMFVIGLSELWHWTGNDRLLRRFRDPALRAIEWAERSRGPANGFLTYERRSPAGLRNQGWKDSDEAIRHADGTIADPPLATVEEQSFHFLALQRMGEILVALDDPDRAGHFLDRAADLRRRWHEAFWMPREGFYALALESDGRQVRSITSNPGHALGAGIVPPEVARHVADRLLSPALFSGWGVRTLADDHASYNPFGYHLGTVWPVENATFALGFKRYGLDDHLERLAEAQIEAAAAFAEARLPEALTGHRREPGVAPRPYPNACAPQAWSSSAVVQMVQVMLGLYPFAPLRILSVIRPRLPAWLPEVTLRNLRVGRAVIDLRFTRRSDGSASHKVLRRAGSLLVVPAGPPVDANGRPRPWLEAVGIAALERAPGRLVRAARIAIGLEEETSDPGPDGGAA